VTQHYPWVVAFTFGLLHGFGFAGALAEVGLPQSSIPIALLFFNVGVEIGQLMFVGGCVDSDRSRLARATPASIVATRMDLAHRAVCHRCARELLAGRTNRRVLTTGCARSRRSMSLGVVSPDHTRAWSALAAPAG
jgi:hypothetical protein